MAFVPNPRFEDELKHGPEMLAMLQDAADKSAAEAQRTAPVATGAYRDSISGEAGLDEQGEPVGRVNATDWKAWMIETGTLKRGPAAVLRRAVESQGYTVKGTD
jgi:hypothetical protein